MTNAPGSATAKDRALRAIAILGLIVILLLGAWGIIQIAFALYGFLGNTGSSSPTSNTKEQVVVTAPATIASGQSFNLSFAHQNSKGNYAYDISYACADGLSVQAPLPTGAMQAVPCNTPFNYTGATSNMPLTATLSGNAPVTTTFTVAARNLSNNATTASGTANSNVSPAASSNTASSNSSSSSRYSYSTPKPKSRTTYVAAAPSPALYGSPDLAVSINSITGSNGSYSATFTIQNVGTNVTPANWIFNAWLPTNGGYTYTSAPQQTLRPGDKIVYTLSFNTGSAYNNSNYQNYYSTNYPYGNGYYYYANNCNYAANYTYNGAYTYPGYNYNCNNTPTYYPYNTTSYPYSTSYYPTSGVVTITVDPNNYIGDSNESNNTASATINY